MIGIRWGSVECFNKKLCENVIIVASGPSVKDINLNALKRLSKGYIIAVNGAGAHVPYANAWFTLDPWGLDGPQLPVGFRGKCYAAVPDDYGTPNARSSQHRVVPSTKITFLHRLHSHNLTNVSSETAYKTGLSEDNSCINTGNSGYGALNFAYHLRPKNIYLLGIDGSMGYFYNSPKTNRPLTYLKELFNSSVPQITERGINVFNVSPQSTITAYPKITPAEFHERLKEMA